MIAAKVRQNGTTLAELLVAVVFLALCATGIVSCLAGSGRNSGYAARRAAALTAASSVLDVARAQAHAGSLTAGVTGPFDVSGIPAPATYTRTVTSVTGTTDLFEVSVTVSWKEHPRGTDRDDSLSLTTRVRSPDG